MTPPVGMGLIETHEVKIRRFQQPGNHRRIGRNDKKCRIDLRFIQGVGGLVAAHLQQRRARRFVGNPRLTEQHG